MSSKNAEAVKRWRKKHHGLFLLRQRQYRQKKLIQAKAGVIEPISEPVADKQQKLAELRALMAGKNGEAKRVMESAKPEIYRDDFGRIISQKQWYLMMEHKAKAREKGYEIDEYTQ